VLPRNIRDMNKQTTDQQVREQAADWYDRLAELSADEQQDYQRWLLQSPEHAAAMAWLQQHLGACEHDLLTALAAADHNVSDDRAAEHKAAGEPAARHWRDAVRQFWHSLWPLPAAALAVLLVVGIVYPLLPPADSAVTRPLSYRTATGEQRTEQLADGSEIHMNALSALSVTMQPAQRQVRLEQGEAYFSVAADKQRPFYVDAGSVQIRVVGTAFNVDHTSDGVSIAVAHGEVRVTAGTQHWTLHAGDGVRIRGEQGERYQAGEVSDWRKGWRRVEGEPLADVVAHLQRYSTRPIRLQGIVQTLPFSGRYNQSDVEGTLSLIASLFGLSLQISDDLILLSGHDPGPH